MQGIGFILILISEQKSENRSVAVKYVVCFLQNQILIINPAFYCVKKP